MKDHFRKKKTQKTFFAVVAILVFLFSDIQAFAASCNISVDGGSVDINMNDMMNCVEKRYGYDKDSLRRSKQKAEAPDVTMFFDKTNPRDGEKTTATAVARSFKTPNEELYYTWYILHDKDQDGQADNTIEEGKEEAMGRVARGSFEPVLFGISADQYQSDADTDHDGFLASYGGLNGVGAKGLSTNDNGMSDSDNDGVANSKDNCENKYNPNQKDTDNDGDGDACDSDPDEDGISNADDNCPNKYNKEQKDSDNDSLGDACDPTPTPTPYNDDGDTYTKDEDKDNDGIVDSQDNCYGKYNPGQSDDDADGIGDSCDDKDNTSGSSSNGCGVGDYEKPDETGVIKTECITRCFRHNFGIKAYQSSADGFSGEASADPDSGKDLVVSCQHQFPQISGSRHLNVAGGSVAADCSDTLIGDGVLTDQEEACWKLDPTNPDTDGDGYKDEEDLAGLNQQQFTWNYQKGDRVGVIVEGTSMIPTNEENLNAYYKIMWATPGICSESDVSKADGDECDGSGDYGFNFMETKAVNEYNEENLQLSLNSNPKEPQYDVLDQASSDEITVSAGITNDSIDDRFTYFKWDVYRCANANSSDCVTENVYNESGYDPERDSIYLTPECQVGKDQKPEQCAINLGTPLEGLGLKQITFKPKKELMQLGLSKEYFKVVVRASRQKIDDNFKRYSISDLIIPVTQSDMGIKLYKVEKSDDGTYKLGEEICNTGIYRKICPVFPYQLVGAKAISFINEKYPEKFNVSSYAWQLNGNPLPAPMICPFESCGSGNEVFFPVLGTTMDIGNLGVTAQRRDSGENLVSQRMFSVNEPMARVSSNDTSTAWPFIRFDGQEADSVFETYPGNRVSFRADLVPDYLSNEEVSLAWYMSGQELTPEVLKSNPEIKIEDNIISFPVDGTIGSSINLAARVEKKYPAEEKQLLRSAWGIDNSHDLVSDNSVDVKLIYKPVMTQQTQETASLKLFLASTVTNAPHFMLFTLRLAIGMTLILSLLIGLSFGVKFGK